MAVLRLPGARAAPILWSEGLAQSKSSIIDKAIRNPAKKLQVLAPLFLNAHRRRV
jgi:hypothetical protein